VKASGSGVRCRDGRGESIGATSGDHEIVSGGEPRSPAEVTRIVPRQTVTASL
jgi:hypothetical protein